MGKTQQHLQILNINDMWETPKDVFLQACKDFKIEPELDVAATKHNSLCKEYFTPEDNSLNHPWTRPFFMNPPYSQIFTFMQKAHSEWQKHNVSALILTFAKTDTKWWHKFVEGQAEYHFIQGRMRFLLDGIRPRYCSKCKERRVSDSVNCPNCGSKMKINAAPYPSTWIVYRGSLA